MNLTRLFVQRPTLVTVFVALVTLAGTIAAFVLVKQQYPNYDVPTIQVLVTYPGASTTEMRDAIVRPLEDQVAGAPDLQSIESAIQPGQATIVARFVLSSDVNTDLVQVQGRVQNAQRQLPNDLQAPQVSIYDPSQAVVVSLVASSATLAGGALSSMVVTKIVPSLEQIPGVSFVETNGNVTPSLEVNVRPKDLLASGFTLTDIVSTISSNNVRAPGGIIYTPDRETNIDIRGDVQDAPSVANLLLSAGGTGASTGSTTSAFGTSPKLWRVGDVATITDSAETQRVYAFSQGKASISLDVQKTSNTSEVTASDNVIAALPLLRKQYPGVDFTVLNIQSTYTRDELSGVVRVLIEGVLFTGLVMLFFLRSWRNAVVVMVAIPTSLLVTLAAMRVANFTLDTVSLLAMTLIIGILVDDSIVVLENVERHAEDGEPPEEAAVKGRMEIGVAAIVITLVDVVVFLPISFLPGTVGLFLREFGLVVTVATLTSLFVSFTVTPSLAGRWSLLSTWKPWRPIDAFTNHFDRLRTWYTDRALSSALARPVVVIAISVVTFLLAVLLIPLGIVGFEFIPAVDRGELYLTLNYPIGTPLAKTREGVLAVERYVDGIGDVSAEYALAGAYQGNLSGYVSNGAIGQIHIFLKPNRAQSTTYWVSRMQREAARYVSGVQITAIPATDASGGIQQPIDEVVSVPNGDPSTYAAQVLAVLQQAKGATDVTTSAGALSPQVEVQFDRDRARALDVPIGTTSSAIRAASGGTIATQYTGPDGLKDVFVIYPQGALTDLTAITTIAVRSSSGGIVHVGDVAHLVQAPAPPLITRINRQSVVYLGANIADGAFLSNVQNDFGRRLKALNLPANVVVAPVAGGNQESVTETIVGMSASLALSILLVYLLMVALYDSYRTPFVIMFSVPVAVVGALGSLALTHQTLNLFSFIGSVLLVGLVSKNGILLVDFANRLRREGTESTAAVRESARERFRPIIMTTIAMIAGMTPLALSLDPGSQAERSLGTVVIGGLTSSLLLTLLLVPIVYLRFAPSHEALRASGGPLEETGRRVPPTPTGAPR
jgi:HAE1 family hydrophobic/amphiphilic exporter-1